MVIFRERTKIETAIALSMQSTPFALADRVIE